MSSLLIVIAGTIFFALSILAAVAAAIALIEFSERFEDKDK